MSSTNKTSLGLNSWIGSDIPSRADFNSDNSIIDLTLSSHIEDGDIHTTPEDKAKWDEPYYVYSFAGDGQSSRSITLSCSFKPTWGIIFKASSPPQTLDINNRVNLNYFAIFSKNGSNSGVSISSKTISLTQSSLAFIGNEYLSFNEIGSSYIIIAFR